MSSNEVSPGNCEAPSITPSKGKASHWSITLNNPTADEINVWANLKQYHWVKEVVGQLEEGEEKTPHIQGYLRTSSVRFAQLKAVLPRAHIEQAKNSAALKQYAQKEETRIATLSVKDKPESIHAHLHQYMLNWCHSHRLYQNDKLEWQVKKVPKMPYDEEYLNMILLDAISTGKGFFTEKHNEHFFDETIKTMIEKGVPHIEFMGANNLMRSAFKKYLPSILYRQINESKGKSAQEKSSETQSDAWQGSSSDEEEH